MKLFRFAAVLLTSVLVIVPAAAGIYTYNGHPLPFTAAMTGRHPSWANLDAADPATLLLLAASVVLLVLAGRAQGRAARL
jgi:hypothetical protein